MSLTLKKKLHRQWTAVRSQGHAASTGSSWGTWDFLPCIKRNMLGCSQLPWMSWEKRFYSRSFGKEAEAERIKLVIGGIFHSGCLRQSLEWYLSYYLGQEPAVPKAWTVGPRGPQVPPPKHFTSGLLTWGVQMQEDLCFLYNIHARWNCSENLFIEVLAWLKEYV